MNNLVIRAIYDLESWTPIRIKDKNKFEKWFLSNIECQEFFHYYDVNSTIDGGFDTADRDILMNEIANLLTGRTWPIYMEGNIVMESFYKILKNALIYHEFLEWRE